MVLSQESSWVDVHSDPATRSQGPASRLWGYEDGNHLHITFFATMAL